MVVKTITNGVSIELGIRKDKNGYHVTIVHATKRYTIGSLFSYGNREEAIKEAEYYAAQRMGFLPYTR